MIGGRLLVLLVLMAGWAEPLRSEEPSLDDWLARLTPPPAESLPLTIPFKEARTYPFRKYPKDFSGKIILEANGDVRVDYAFPSAYRLVLTDGGARLEEPGGDTRDLGNPPGLALLRSLMRWDVPGIERAWDLTSAAESDGATILELAPADARFAEKVSSLTIVFRPERVTGVTVKQTDGQQRDYQFAPPVDASAAP